MALPTGYPGGGLRLARNTLILCGAGSPNSSTTPDVILAGVSSLYIQTDAVGLWQCVVAGNYDAPSGATTPSQWTQITVP